METAGCELQALVLATSEKGEVTGAPLDGVVTVIANDGTTLAAHATRGRSRDFINPPVTVIANDGTTLAANATRGRSRDFINPPSNIYLGRILGLARSKLFASKDLPKNWAVL